MQPDGDGTNREADASPSCQDTQRFGFLFLKHSLSDYPGEVCAVVFIPGCNFHCPYCHNKNLATVVEQEGWTLAQIESYLQAARPLLTGICITGGEPTLSPDMLHTCIDRFKAIGLKVKVDTNGSRPAVLRSILPKVDYIAMDLKTSLKRYPALVAPDEQTTIAQNIAASIQLLLALPPQRYEFRTTLARDWTQTKELHACGSYVHKKSNWYLQRCHEDTASSAHPTEAEHLQQCLRIAQRYSDAAALRGG